VTALLFTPSAAGAASVFVYHDEDPTGHGETTHGLSVVDRRGEPNDLLIRSEGLVTTVRELGRARLTAGRECTQRARRVVRCKSDELLDVSVRAGARSDRVECIAGPLRIDGGPGDDQLLSRECGGDLAGRAGDDRLVGGSIRDALAAGAGHDVLLGRGGHDWLKGDVSASGADVLNGGPGHDRASWPWSPRPVHVNLRRETGPKGDRVRSIEDATGGSRDDVLIGTDQANRLQGGPGNDRLVGRGGDDRLNGGNETDVRAEGSDGLPDRVSCGDGRDRVSYPDQSLLPADCERMSDYVAFDFQVLPIFPRRAGEDRVWVPAIVGLGSADADGWRRRAVLSSGGVELGRSELTDVRDETQLLVLLGRPLPDRAQVRITVSGQDYYGDEYDGWYDVEPFVWLIRCRGGPNCRGS
jgi:Ca2+-binding RTX toxin-like protein